MEVRAGRGLRHGTSPDGETRTIELDRVAMAALLPPTGAVFAFAGNVPPAGYLLCDGSAVSRGDYAGLFGLIGTTYGVGDGSTTFNLPDLRGRVPVGQNAATFSALGGTGGEETHVLTTAEMASHSHDQRKGAGSGGAQTHNSSAATFTSSSITTGDSTSTTGSDTAHNNLQPYQVLIYIIKY